MQEGLVEKIQEVIFPFFSAGSVELVELIVRQRGRDLVVEVLADKPEGGITLDECAVLNQHIGAALEQLDFMPENYFLEVSSPGLDRPLKTTQDFRRVANREIEFFLSQPVGGRLQYNGVVETVDKDQVTVNFKSQKITIPLKLINKARQVI